MSALSETDLIMIRYFWEEKGDVERYIAWNEIMPALERERPEIVKAWRDYVASRRVLSAVISTLPSS